MMDFQFLENDLFENTVNGRVYRILWLDVSYTYCYVIRLSVDRLEIEKEFINSLQEDLVGGIIQLLEEDPSTNIIDLDDEKLRDNERIEKAFSVVNKFLKLLEEPYCYDRFRRASAVNQLLKELKEKNDTKAFNVGKKYIYAKLRTYWQGGKMKSALLPKYDNCGRSRKGDGDEYDKLGRPPSLHMTDGDGLGVNVCNEDKKIFEIAINRYFIHRDWSLPRTYEQMITKFYKIPERELKEKEPGVRPSNEIPSYGQFKSWYYNQRNIVDETKRKYGEKKYSLQYRPITSDSIHETLGPGFRYQVDATVGDVYLVNRIDRKSVIGRPVVYIAIDVYSRLIVGVHVCLEGPSWNGMSSLIYNCYEDKVKYCEKFGIDINKDDWDVSRLPRVILADRGELIGPIADPIIEGLGMKVENTGSYRGDAKGIVEQHFRIINTKIKKWLPGEVKKEYRERGDRDYRLDAKLDIYQFTQIIINSILNKNKSIMEDYPITAGMVEDKVNPIPIEIWNYGISTISGARKKYDEDVLRSNLLRRGTATVTGRGITFNKLNYSCVEAEKGEWFSKARITGTRRVDIAYDNRDISNIYIIDKRLNKVYLCKLIEGNSYNQLYRKKTYEELIDYNFMRFVQKNRLSDTLNQNKFDMDSSIEKIIKDAVKMSDGQKNEVKNIKSNRRIENDDYRINQALINKDELDYNKKVIQDVNLGDVKDEEVSESTLFSMMQEWDKEERGLES